MLTPVQVQPLTKPSPKQLEDLGKSALYYNDQKAQQLIIATHSINELTTNGSTFLHTAATYKMLDIVKSLFSKFSDLDVNSTNAPESCTPIYLAAQNGDLEIVNYLLSHRADINKANAKGATPLLIAAEKGHFNVAQRLIQCGAQVNVVDAFKLTPLIYAIKANCVDIVDLLIKSGANVNFMTRQCGLFTVTPFSAAIYSRNCEIIKLFISHPNFTPYMLFEEEPVELLQALMLDNINVEMIDLLLESKKFPVTDSIIFYAQNNNLGSLITAHLEEALNDKEKERVDDVELPDPGESELELDSEEEEEITEVSTIASEPPFYEEPPLTSSINVGQRRRWKQTPLELPPDAFASHAVSLQNLDYHEFVGNQMLEWERQNSQFEFLKGRPLKLDMHTGGAVISGDHVNNFMLEAFRLLKEKQYTGRLNLVTGRGNHSFDGIPRVKIKTINWFKQQNIPYRKHRTNPGRLILRFEKGRAINVE